MFGHQCGFKSNTVCHYNSFVFLRQLRGLHERIAVETDVEHKVILMHYGLRSISSGSMVV